MAGRWGSIVALAIASGAGAQQAPRTVQQDFEAATALDAGTDQAAALAAWDALAQRTARNPRSHAIATVRRSAALMRLNRRDEAVAAARLGLANLPAGDRTLDNDRFTAWFTLGQVARSAIDYASAGDAYEHAERFATAPIDKLSALYGLIASKTFTDPDAALAATTRADALLASTATSPKTVAQFASAKGILLMNRGELTGAVAETKRAVKLLGGLTERTELDDVSVRSDAAIALLLSGKGEAAREYMAMTGAGRLTKGAFDPAAEMQPPTCGGEAGLKPADMAVVEFSVADDGSVMLARPIYAAGGGVVAQEFARAARNWSWTPDKLKQMPAFFRYNARVEMRCTMQFERPSVADGLLADLEAWLESKGQSPVERPGAAAAILPAQRAALVAAMARSPAGLEVAAAALPLMRNSVIGREEAGALAQQALAIAIANGAPPTARLWLDLQVRYAATADLYKTSVYRRQIAPLSTAQPYADDPKSRGAIGLLLADNERDGSKARARAMLQAVAADPALAKNDPLKVGALIRIASMDQEAGDLAGARAAFERSGLAASQCAILDNPPKFEHAGGTFPQEAMRWGFEGWTMTQFDVDARGHVLNQRAIISYPPFVFTKAGTETVRGAVYSKSFRPDGGLGCGATSQRVKFMMPG